ncbi:SNF7 family protein, charged multivesicular body protein 2A [Pseudohyphozyma bogoriensis]|nr:SNF7 family protein, charged multivesicular body protein 2A [Pseudohyphozyma bogoriensis]
MSSKASRSFSKLVNVNSLPPPSPPPSEDPELPSEATEVFGETTPTRVESESRGRVLGEVVPAWGDTVRIEVDPEEVVSFGGLFLTVVEDVGMALEFNEEDKDGWPEDEGVRRGVEELRTLLEENGVEHGDWRAPNVCMRDDGQLVAIDFGQAAFHYSTLDLASSSPAPRPFQLVVIPLAFRPKQSDKDKHEHRRPSSPPLAPSFIPLANPLGPTDAQESLFGRSKTPAERLRAHQRSLQKAQRELDRERTKLEAQEKKLVADIKASARKGQMNACKVMAKDLVRTRQYISKFYGMKTQLQAVSLRIQTLRSNQQMAEAMKGATKAMSLMSRQMNLPQIQRILTEFERESSQMDMKEEMMGESIDDVMEDGEGEGEEEQSDKILEEVLAEIGISVGQQLGEAPTTAPPTSVAESTRTAVAEGGGGFASGGGGGVDDLQSRLDALRKD